MKLEEIINKYGVPDPKIVGKLPKAGMQLDFVGHADVTKMLIEIDPEWTWEPTAFDTNGLPAYRVENGMAHMAGWLTVQGVRRLGIGSVAHNKPDLLKELVSDFIRNSAMRFGICLALWTKQEWEDVSHTPSKPTLRPVPVTTQTYSKPVVQEPEVIDSFQDVDQVLANVVDLFAGAEVVEQSRNNHPANGTPQIKEPSAPATSPQLGKLRALCNGAGISSREDQLSMASEHTKRTITSFDDLTKKEASELITIFAPV